MSQLLAETAQLDFKSIRSLVGLLRPGYLTTEYLAGRRQRLLSPLKIYLLVAALFFLAAPYVFGFSLEQLLQDDQDAAWRALVDARIAATDTTFDVFAERFAARVRSLYTLSLGLSVIACAAMLRLLFGRTAPAFASHLVFALHYVAFFYLAALVVNALNRLLDHPDPLVLLAIQYAVLAPYAYLAMKRVHREGSAQTLLKCGAMLVAAFVVDIPIEIGTMRLTIALT